MDPSNEETRAKFDSHIHLLFDKYLKANDNYLPLKAYLEFLESESYDEFTSISNVKQINSNEPSAPIQPPTSLSLKPASAASTPFTTTLNLFKSTNSNDSADVMLSQKLYKIVVSIDYSPQRTSLDFIKKSLEVIFTKIANEYDAYCDRCYNTEPQIYVTVLLWNMSYFYSSAASGPTMGKIDEHFFLSSSQAQLPFTIICHSKRLLKSNINEMARFVYSRVNESKSFIIDAFSHTGELFTQQQQQQQPQQHTDLSSLSVPGVKSKSPFEEFLRIIIRIFEYFCINEISTSVSAPTALACAHHVHITDGLLNATDTMKCLEKLSKTAISYSFVYSGRDYASTAANISSSFGYLADHSLMKFIAHITGGFCLSIDENLDTKSIVNRRLFYFYRIPQSTTQSSRSSSKANIMDDLYSVDGYHHKSSIVTALMNSCGTDVQADSHLDAYASFINYSERINATAGNLNKKSSNQPGEDIRGLLMNDSHVSDQLFEYKRLQKYEQTDQKYENLLQIVRIRAHEGFFLAKIVRSPTQDKLITLYFKKYFTQTITLIYKISYLVSDSQPGDQQTGSEPNSTSNRVGTNPSVPVSINLYFETWISWNFLHLRSKYQNLELMKKVKTFLQNLPISESSLKLTECMFNPPDILNLKEPLFKLVIPNDVNMTGDGQETGSFAYRQNFNYQHHHNHHQHHHQHHHGQQQQQHNQQAPPQQQLHHHMFSFNNLNFELNSCLNKIIEKKQFNEYANEWKLLAFFKFNKTAMNKYFSLHSLKIILDHDRPMPDASVPLFDMKTAMILTHLQLLHNSSINQASVGGSSASDQRSSSSSGYKLYDGYGYGQTSQSTGAATAANESYLNPISLNHATLQNNIFMCLTSSNRLRAMLIEWCDVMLVENFVYLKYLSCSSKYAAKRCGKDRHRRRMTTDTTSAAGDVPSSSSVTITSTAEQNDEKSFDEKDSANTTNETVHANDHTSDSNYMSLDQTDGSATPPPAPVQPPAQQQQQQQQQQQGQSSSVPPSVNILNASTVESGAEGKNSFVMVKIDIQYVPCISLQFLFYSNVSYSDRIRIIEKFKEKLREFNIKNLSQLSPGGSGAGLQANTVGTATSTTPTTQNAPQSAAILPSQTTNIFLTTQQSQSQSKSNNNSLINLSFDESQLSSVAAQVAAASQQQQQQQAAHSVGGSQSLLSQLQPVGVQSKSTGTAPFSECFHLLHKPDLFDAFRYALFEDYMLERSRQDDCGVASNNRMYQSSSKSINFMHRRKFTWKISRSFATQAAQTLKETIIDTFIRVRLKEGFKCLFTCPKFAVFTVQLTMFDSGEVSGQPVYSQAQTGSQSWNAGSTSASNAATLKLARGSAQICTFIYVIRFMNTPLNVESSNGRADKPNVDTKLSSLAEQELYFTTELYFEAIDGIYQERRNTAGTLSTTLSSSVPPTAAPTAAASANSKKILREKQSFFDYFKNLNNAQICNLIYLSDLKSFSTLQSIYSLFIGKSNTIGALNSLISSSPSTAPGSDQLRTGPGCQLSDLSIEILNNIHNYDVNFFESVHLMPDLGLILRRHTLRESGKYGASAVNQTTMSGGGGGSGTTTSQTATNANSASSTSATSHNTTVSSTNLINRIKLSNPRWNPKVVRTDASSPLSCDENAKTTSGPTINLSKTAEERVEEISATTTAVVGNKKKRLEAIPLQDQLRPLLDSLDLTRESNHTSSASRQHQQLQQHVNVDFAFSLRCVLAESALYVCVFEDIPFNLFNFSPTHHHHGGTKSMSRLEYTTIKTIETYFFDILHEQLRTNFADSAGVNARQTFPSHASHHHHHHSHHYQPYQPAAKQPPHQHQQQHITDEVLKTYDHLTEAMKRDVKNALTLKLNDIKSGDSTTKQIIENLKSTDTADTVKVYLKYNIVQSTARVGSQMSSSSSSSTSAATGSNKPNDLFRTSTGGGFVQAHSNDVDQNKFFIYGFFFLNDPNAAKQLADTSQSAADSPISMASGANRLVFFLFNPMLDNAKNSLIQTQSNTYLFRKLLFTPCASGGGGKADGHQTYSRTGSTTTTFTDYRFYYSKNAPRLNSISLSSSSSGGVQTSGATNGATKTFMRKFHNMSDIIKYNVNVANSSMSDNGTGGNVAYLASFLDQIEEKCAKSYVKSLLHYMATYAMANQLTQTTNFDAKSVQQLLKLGFKIKLLDLDLTDYYRLTCSHMPPGSDRACLEVDNLKYLENKFDEVFARRFYSLPGFNDLFVFTSLAGSAGQHQQHLAPLPYLEVDMDQLDDDNPNEENQLDDDLDNGSYDDDDRDNDAGGYETYSDSETLDYHEFGGEPYHDDGDDVSQDDIDNQDGVGADDLNDDDSQNSDLNPSHYELDATGPISLSSSRHRNKSRLKSSSPYSSSTMLSKFRSCKLRGLMGQTNDADTCIDASEQLIGLELVVIINTNVDVDLDCSSSTLDVVHAHPRTRTATLTPDTINSLEHITAPGDFYNNYNQHSFPSLVVSQPSNANNNNVNPAVMMKKIIFTSTFSRFNLSCIYDVIGEKNQTELDKIFKKYKEVRETAVDEDTAGCILDVKLYLRINWYSFNELYIGSGTSGAGGGLFTSNTGKKVAQHQTDAYNQQSQQSQPQPVQYHYPFIRTSETVSGSSSSLLYTVDQQQPDADNKSILAHSTDQNTGAHQQPHRRNRQRRKLTTATTATNANRAKHQTKGGRFEYAHQLNPSLKEFKWYLTNEIYQLDNATEIKNMRAFYAHLNHIHRGARHRYAQCHIEKKKLVVQRTTTTVTTSIIDAQPKTNASKLPLSAKRHTTTTVEEDKSIITVDMGKFFEELTHLVQTFQGRLFSCRLQRMREPRRETNDAHFYLQCTHGTSGFKILIHLKKETIRTSSNSSNNGGCGKTSPSSQQQQQPQQQSMSASLTLTDASNTSGSQVLARSPNYLSVGRKKSAAQVAQQQQQHQQLPNKEPVQPPSQQIQQQPNLINPNKQAQVSQEVVTNQVKIKIYFSFNNAIETSAKSAIIGEFNKELDNLIRLSYLTIILKEIHDTLKWNNLLSLRDPANERSDVGGGGGADDHPSTEDDGLIRNGRDTNYTLTSGGKSQPGDNDSLDTLRHSLTAYDAANSQPSLVCQCVWSVLFKLHRLHQTQQKTHDTATGGATTVTVTQPTSGSSNYQTPRSQGLNKLRESLVNFRIEESNCGDLYVYTKLDQKEQIYLLKLEEVYGESSTAPVPAAQAPAAHPPSSTHALQSQTMIFDDNSNDGLNMDSNEKSTNKQQNRLSALSRRPSYASITDTNEQTNKLQTSIGHTGKSHNLSGSGTTTNAQIGTSGTATPYNTNVSNAPTASMQTRLNPEYIRLSVFGLQEPDDEMKQSLCKTLQSELDYWLLIKMCNSIEKNTYKTTSAQHPDKITDEDLVFFKQICDNYFDFEIPLPFVFNFNRTLRENFFYFVKQIFNANFKTIDASHVYTLNVNKRPSMESKPQHQQPNQQQQPQHETTDQTTDSVTTQPVSSTFQTQHLSFSFMAQQPSLGPFEVSGSKSLTNATATAISSVKKPPPELDQYSILLTRIFFHNSKNSRIGKHNVSLVLVEALYSVKGLDYAVTSKITRSNSIGTTNSAAFSAQQQQQGTFTKQISQMNPVLETSYTKCRQMGPTFVFRFYCRGENTDTTNSYKVNLKAALNDALLYFLSEYLTKIDPELYLKQIDLKKKPATFRTINLINHQFEPISVTTCGSTSTPTGNPVITAEEELKIRKRHKSTGVERAAPANYHLTNCYVLKMNKSALDTRLGRLLQSQKITDESHLNAFIVNNFGVNLFDHKDYQDTVEYFRESIRSFDYNRIFNQIVVSEPRRPTPVQICTSFTTTGHDTDDTDDDDEENDGNESDSADDADVLLKSGGSSSSSSSVNLILPDNKPQPAATQQQQQPSHQLHVKYSKSHLRLIYEWLKGLYQIQMRANVNVCSRSTGCMQTLTTSSVTTTPITQTFAFLQKIPSSAQMQTSQSASPSPSLTSANTTSATTSSGAPGPSSFILRKQFNYRTKYNLINFVRDLENSVRDLCKCDVNANYFSFKRSTKLTADTELDHDEEEVFDEHELPYANEPYVAKTKSERLEARFFTATDRAENVRFFTDDFDVHSSPNDDFAQLRRTRFGELHQHLCRSDNLIITMNAEYNNTTLIGNSNNNNNTTHTTANSGLSSSLSQSMSSSMNSSTLNTTTANSTTTPTTTTTNTNTNNTSGPVGYNRVPSFSGAHTRTATTTSDTGTVTNLMMKSISSTSGDLDSSMSLSNTMTSSHSPQLKRTYCYAIVNAKTKLVTFYCFTTESANYDSLKQLLDQAADTISQRFHLVNNIVLYKLGGLIGDQLIYDIKKVKQLTLSSCHSESAPPIGTPGTNSNVYADFSNDSPNADLKFFKLAAAQAAQVNPKLSKSPTMHRQLSLSKGAPATSVSAINPSLITSLQFSSGNSGSTASLLASPSSSSATLTSNNSSASNVSATTTTTNTTPGTTISIKQLYLNHFNDKFYDSIVNVINQQILFCFQYLTTGAPAAAATPASQSTPQQQSTQLLASHLTASNNNISSLMTSSAVVDRTSSNVASATGHGLHHHHHKSSCLYGVGLSYQLYEMQQIYRHPRKIYEIATSTVNPVAGSATPVSGSILSTHFKIQPTVSDIYRNFVQPVLIPFHYCAAPLLFYPNWHDMMITENTLKLGAQMTPANKLTKKPEPTMPSNVNTTGNVKSTSTSVQPTSTIELWYAKMRQIVLIEYSKYFETRGFIKLKDEPKQQTANATTTSTSKSQQQQHQQQQTQQQQQQQQQLTSETQTYHFIKWILQDGFLYITMNIEEIYMCIKLAYCTRYRSASRMAFINETIKFFAQEFHLHSFIYDFHLSAINANFLTSSLTMQISQTASIISKFLDEFDEFFTRMPIHSTNKVFKLIHEKSDNSLIPHQFRLIFDFLMHSIKKLAKSSENVNVIHFKPLRMFDNNIAIYSLTDNNTNQPQQQQSLGKQPGPEYSKFLVIKVESFYKETTTVQLTSSSSHVENSISSRQMSKYDFGKQTSVASTKFSNSSSSSLSLLAANNTTVNANYSPSNMADAPKKSSLTTITQHQPQQQQQQTKQEPFIRMTCYYLYINKSQHSQLIGNGGPAPTSTSLASISLANSLGQDLNYIKRVIDESINMYKQEIFWDNLNLSMYSASRRQADDDEAPLKTSSSSPVSSGNSLTVDSDELEQILEVSTKIDIIDLDASLSNLLRHCYHIKEKIKKSFESLFKRHYIYTQSNSAEYCILLINDDFIRNFRAAAETTTSSATASNDKNLKSFILLEFNQANKCARLFQVNRVKSATPEQTATTTTTVPTAQSFSHLGQQQQQPPQSVVGKRFTSSDTAVDAYPVASSLKSELFTTGSNYNNSFVNRTHKYLSFTVNFLIYVLWKSVFNVS